ncbi:hypothetical protein [Enterocloster sp.]|uniref:hypothetical protein n=1 Tax=Enterocloster sp. TaxID=2719315 RepID=UPI0039A035C1
MWRKGCLWRWGLKHRAAMGSRNGECEKYDIILLDVDGTLLDFGLAEAWDGDSPEDIRDGTHRGLSLYHDINEGLWSAERGEVTKDRLVWEGSGFSLAGLEKWMATRWRNYTAASWRSAYLIPGPWIYAGT